MEMKLRVLGRIGVTLSRIAGWGARARWPAVFLRLFLRWYCRRFEVDLCEARRTTADFRTFQEFFTRELKAGLRPMPADTKILVSPVDGRIAAIQGLSEDVKVEAKQVAYRLSELLGSDLITKVEPDSFSVGVTIYLSPGDYHRIHAPYSMRILGMSHIPGTLYPVNDWARSQVPSLFSKNERIILDATVGPHRVMLALIGACIVGRIRLSFIDAQPTAHPSRSQHVTFAEPIIVARGQEIAQFELGSTIILILPAALSLCPQLRLGLPIRVGAPIARVPVNTPSEDSRAAGLNC